MRVRLVAMAALLLLGAAKADLPASAPDANGWSVKEGPAACILFSDAKLAFVAPDGQHVALVSPGALGGAKAFNLDGARMEAEFKADGGVVVAPVSDDMLGKLLQSTRIRADWPDTQIDTKPPVMQSLIDLRSCGGRIAAKRAADTAKAEKRRQFLDRLARAGAAASASSNDDDDDIGPSRSSRGGTGMTCMLKREWTSGMNKNCVYDCLGSEAVQTQGSVSLCPLTMRR